MSELSGETCFGGPGRGKREKASERCFCPQGRLAEAPRKRCYVAEVIPVNLTPSELRAKIRAGGWQRPTAGCCDGYVQANLVIVPTGLAHDFHLFCQRNPQPCPLLEVTDPGDFQPRTLASGADLRTDLPKYRVYRSGTVVTEAPDIVDVWRGDLVSFLLGCSFTFDAALQQSGVPVRHVEESKNVPMYVTNRSCQPAGPFSGPLVVTMRPIPETLVARAVDISDKLPLAHGAPVHIGDPAGIGIEDLERPHYGEPVSIRPAEVPVFWACGVTPQAALVNARPDLAITHAPGHMFVSDLRHEDLAGLYC